MKNGIVIYSTEGNVMFTSTGEIDTNKKNIRKHKVNKNITNPIFEDLKSYTDSQFWKTFLTKASRNIFPKDFKFMNDVLYYKLKTKKHRAELYLKGEDLEKNLGELKDFLKLKGIFPKEELMKDETIKIEKRELIKKWKDLGKKRINILDQYLHQLEEEYNLSPTEYKYTESLIKLLINSEILNNDKIIIENEKIKYIKFLEWNEEERKFNIDMNEIKIKYPKIEKRKKGTFYTLSTYSNDNKINFVQNLKTIDMEKKWEKFLTLMYIKK